MQPEEDEPELQREQGTGQQPAGQRAVGADAARHAGLHRLPDLAQAGADIGIASERLSNDPTLVAFPWFRWHHSLLVPKDHPLTQVTPLTLDAIARWPLITYRQGITGRSRIDEAFNRKGLMPDIVLSAQDSDVIKTYVELGLGVGLVAEQSGDARESDTFTRLDTRLQEGDGLLLLALKAAGERGVAA